jgi:hypothetical protein
LPLGSVATPIVDRLAAMRGPNESYSDVILKGKACLMAAVRG